MDISSLVAGAAFALLGVCRVALAGRDPRAVLPALQGAGMVLTGTGVVILALTGPLPARPTPGAVALVAMTGAGLILAAAGMALSRLGRRRWFRRRAYCRGCSRKLAPPRPGAPRS